ncbi:copper resistance protein B [Pelagerythrobacter aerophilus]
MKRSLLLVAASLFAWTSPAAAQETGHGAEHAPPASPATPGSSCTPEHAAMGHCTLQSTPSADPHTGHATPEHQPSGADSGAPDCTQEHAAMGHCTPQAGPASDPHAGHKAPEPSADPHAGHAMPGMTAPDAPPVAPPPPEAFSGPEHAAATIFDPELFERKRQARLIAEHGGYVTGMFLADQLEYRARDGSDGYAWDVQAWYGGDYDKLWLKSEGEGAFGESPEEVEVQALYSRAIDPWFNLQAGVRHDFRPDPERTHLVLGIEGLAPYWFEIGGSLFLSDKGELAARFEAEYDQRITRKLILQPAVELDISAEDVPELGIGSGLSTAEMGLRLRYEFVPEFAPYIGVEYERAFGDTADFRRSDGEDIGGWSVLLGIRSWF